MRKKLLIVLTCLFLLVFLIIYKYLNPFSPKTEDTQFNTFTQSLFRQELSGNTLNLHYTLKNPEEFGIKETKVSLGTYETNSISSSAAIENCLAALHNFSYNKLSDENKLTYDILEDYLVTALEGAPYTLYEEPLSPLTGIQSQLPVLLSEYPFYNTGDIDTYLALLAEIPAYFDSLIAFEQAKADADLFMASYTADSIIEECKSFIRLGTSNYLHSSFANRLENLPDLTTEQKQQYISRNQSLIETVVFPAYQKLAEELHSLRDFGKNNSGLCYFPDGISYYEHLVREQTGSNRSIIELKELTLQQMQDDLQVIQETFSKNASIETISFTLEDSNPISILNTLKKKMENSFPAPPDVNMEVKFVQKEMEEYLSPAFYMVPAIDNIETNVIYVNQGQLPDDLELFTTLAHEGYPGHLYQTTYFASTNPDPVRSILNFGGYTEGWATFCEMISYYYTSLPKEQATLMQRNASIILGIYALADIGIHYDGWTLMDAIHFFQQYGITDVSTIESIYELIVADPANYLKYYIGYVEFLELKKEAISEWGDTFSQKKFHEAVLDIGPASFDVVKKHILKAGEN